MRFWWICLNSNATRVRRLSEFWPMNASNLVFHRPTFLLKLVVCPRYARIIVDCVFEVACVDIDIFVFNFWLKNGGEAFCLV